MASASRNVWSIALIGGLLPAMLATVRPAAAQAELNRSSASAPDNDDTNAAPQPPSVLRPTYQMSQVARHAAPRTRIGRQEAQASYQSNAARYQNPRNRSADEGDESEPRVRRVPRRYKAANRSSALGGGMYENSPISNPPRMQDGREEFVNDKPRGNEYGEQFFSEPASYELSAGNDRNSDYDSINYGQRRNYGGPNRWMGVGGMGFGGLFGSMASRDTQPVTTGGGIRSWMTGGSSVLAGAKPAGSPVVVPEPVVTPDAVYLDAEPVNAAKPAGSPSAMPAMPAGDAPIFDDSTMTEGRSFLSGGPIAGRSYDGFTNPQCNDCFGYGGSSGNCGNGCCGHGSGGPNGPRCGDNYGMYGGCEGGYDCCGGCGPRYGPFNGPYGRPWVLAPIDWLFGGLWHCGPYWGACDPCSNWWWGQDFTVFGGVHDFRSPVNIVGNSNFGFQEGVNWAAPLWQEFGLGAQVGFQVTQSNLQSNAINLYDDYRKQTFLTAGLFHRPCDGRGWQYGVVFDYLHDDYYQLFDVGQLRGELGWLLDCQNELGFWFATGMFDSDNRNDNVILGATTYSAINQYAFYYRRRFCRGGEGRLWGGFAGNSGGLIGADVRLPISSAWAVESGFNYVISEKNENPLFSDQTWNIGMNLVWYWGCNAKCRSLYRPLFNVADNGSFMVTRRGVIGP
ncbi:MAG: hypothetical protein IT427_02085 [Pirellulales bacterium]|nr:hypothetical protein [Pirellulales bacterium]